MPIKKSFIFAAGGLAILLLLPLFLQPYLLLVVILTYVHILLASSLRVSLNAGELNFGVPAFLGIGAYTSALLVTKLGVPFIVAFFAAGILAALASLIIGYPALRLKGVYFLILTWGFVEVVRMVATRWISLTGGPSGVHNVPPAGIAGIEFATKASQYYFALFVTLVVLIILYRLENSRFGLTIKSIRQAEELGETVGVNTYRYKVLAFAVSSFFVGITGSLYAHSLRVVVPGTFNFWLAAMVMVYCFVGGLRGFAGPIVGAAFLFILTEPLRSLMYYERIFYGVVMIVVILFLPGGFISLPARFSPLIERLKRLGKPAGLMPVGKPQ